MVLNSQMNSPQVSPNFTHSQYHTLPQPAHQATQTLSPQLIPHLNTFQQLRPQSGIQLPESQLKSQGMIRSQTYSNLPSDSVKYGQQQSLQPSSYNPAISPQSPTGWPNHFDSDVPLNLARQPNFQNSAQLSVEQGRPLSQVASPVLERMNIPQTFINPSVLNRQKQDPLINFRSPLLAHLPKTYYSEKTIAQLSNPIQKPQPTPSSTYKPLNDLVSTPKPNSNPSHSARVAISPAKSTKLPDPQKPQPKQQTPLPRQPGTSPNGFSLDYPYQEFTLPFQSPYKGEGILPQRKEGPNIFSSPQAPFLLPSRTQAKYSGPMRRHNLPSISRLWGLHGEGEDTEENRTVEKTDDRGKRGTKIFQD